MFSARLLRGVKEIFLNYFPVQVQGHKRVAGSHRKPLITSRVNSIYSLIDNMINDIQLFEYFDLAVIVLGLNNDRCIVSGGG